jgi:hypothetical protein
VLPHPVGRPEFPTPCLTHPPDPEQPGTSYSDKRWRSGDTVAQASGVAQSSYELPLKSISDADPFSGNNFGWRQPHPPLAARLARLVCRLGGCPF